MKAFLKYSIFCCALFTFGIVAAQDIHWTQFNQNPIFQNPGNAGHFKGDMRFVGNFRDQWRSVSVPFQTLSFSFDGKPYNQRNVGYGAMLFHDVAGDGRFRTIEMQLNGSFAIKIKPDSTHVFRPGLNIGINHRQLNWDKLEFGNQFNGIQFDASLPNNENYSTDRKTNISFGAGAIYEWLIAKRKSVTAGFGAYNLNRPNQGFYNVNIPRDIRLNIFAKGSYPIGFDLDLLPSFQFSTQGVYREFIIGSSVKYTLIDKLGEYRALYAGLWYRNKDAAAISVGMDYQAWFVGLSYDVNFSKLVPASNARGGFEIAVRYILFRFKPKQIVHRICPDYI